ncbi:MAG: hypothetical protein ACRDDY_16175 [Clostridium sp.]|uniref:hypothetical protein n=1 Tax=Clostridium sp. TaxID=1506 RepID=UPI003EE78CC0
MVDRIEELLKNIKLKEENTLIDGNYIKGYKDALNELKNIDRKYNSGDILVCTTNNKYFKASDIREIEQKVLLEGCGERKIMYKFKGDKDYYSKSILDDYFWRLRSLNKGDICEKH